MKRIILITLICCPLLVLSQQGKDTTIHETEKNLQESRMKRSNLFVDFGAAIAIGSFNSASTTNSTAGFAGSGLAIRYAYEKLLYKKTRIIAMLGFVQSTIDDAIVKRIQNSLPSSASYKSASNWENSHLLVGFNQQLGIAKKLNRPENIFFCRLLMGLNQTVSPTIALSAYNAGTTMIQSESSVTAYSFATLVGFGTRTYFTARRKKGIVIQTAIDYFSTKPTLSNIDYVQSINGVINSRKLERKQPIKYLQFVFSLGYIL